jgi:tetratricopeptide (TPR) repeat protein
MEREVVKRFEDEHRHEDAPPQCVSTVLDAPTRACTASAVLPAPRRRPTIWYWRRSWRLLVPAAALALAALRCAVGVRAGGGGGVVWARGEERGFAEYGAAHGVDDSGMIIEGEEDEDGEGGDDGEGGLRSRVEQIACVDLEFPEEMMAEALSLQAAGRGEDGLACLRFGASQEPPPDFAEYFETLGTLEEEHGDANAAHAALLRALEVEPDFATSVLKLGNWHAARGEEAAAISYFRRTSEIRPDSPVPFNNLGLALMRIGEKEQAIAAFDQGLTVAQEPQGRAMLYNNLGIIHRDAGDQGLALQAFRDAQEAAPSIEAAINIASTLNDQGQHVAAEEEMRAGLEIGTHPTGLRVLASCLAFQDRLLEAANILVKAALDPDSTRRLLSEVAHELAGRGKGEEAVELMAFAATELSEAEDWYHLGLMLVEMHRNRLGMRVRCWVTNPQP